ncbi:hypothetical protein BVY04_01980 [bacterium M21]|nr:hypothetical protein BVY04_01980 [bacterium M21]
MPLLKPLHDHRVILQELHQLRHRRGQGADPAKQLNPRTDNGYRREMKGTTTGEDCPRAEHWTQPPCERRNRLCEHTEKTDLRITVDQRTWLQNLHQLRHRRGQGSDPAEQLNSRTDNGYRREMNIATTGEDCPRAEHWTQPPCERRNRLCEHAEKTDLRTTVDQRSWLQNLHQLRHRSGQGREPAEQLSPRPNRDNRRKIKVTSTGEDCPRTQH